MKLVRNAVTNANPDLRGKKHHFTIEGATAAELETMDDLMVAEGWGNDTCPLYEEGFSCGYWIDLSDIAQFKADYKAVKAGLKTAMADKQAAIVADEAQYAETVMAEEAEAEAMQIAFFAGNDYAARRAIVEACHTEALAMNTEAEGVEAIATKAGLFDMWEKLDCSPCKKWIDNLEYHYCAARNDECNGGDAATAPQRLFGFNAGDTLRDVFRAVVGQAEEDLAIHVEASHSQALADDRAHNSAWGALAMYPHFNELGTDDRRRKALNAAHAEALAMNAEHDRHASADEMARDFMPQPEPKARRKARIKVKAINNGKYTWRVTMQNGRTYLYTEGEQYAQLRVKSGTGHKYKEVRSSYMLARIQEIINAELSRKRA